MLMDLSVLRSAVKTMWPLRLTSFSWLPYWFIFCLFSYRIPYLIRYVGLSLNGCYFGFSPIDNYISCWFPHPFLIPIWIFSYCFVSISLLVAILVYPLLDAAYLYLIFVAIPHYVSCLSYLFFSYWLLCLFCYISYHISFHFLVVILAYLLMIAISHHLLLTTLLDYLLLVTIQLSLIGY